MDSRITYRQVIARLEENALSHAVLGLQNGVSIVIAERGGRVFGPFLSADSESIFWLHQAFACPDSFRGLLASEEWNLGGERVWIAPEIQFSVRDRADFWGSLHLPEQMDPGRHVLDQPEPGEWRLRQDLTLEAHNLASGSKALHLERRIHRVEDPLRYTGAYSDLCEGVLYAGYEQSVTLSERRADGIVSEAWNLVQLNPGGELLIPASPRAEVTDYMEPVDDSVRARYPHHVALRITGDRRYKVGIKAAHVYGRLAYHHHLDDGRAYLIIRNVFTNPSSPYAEEPAHRPGCRGHAIHVYNDGGMFGGFGELECHGQTIGGETGRSASTDQMILWLYVGEEGQVKCIALHLLGIEI